MATREHPNVLLIMSDEHAPQYSSAYGHTVVRTPNMERLAALGATFDAAYCNSPLCLPSRMSFMTGRFGSRVGSYDNASPLPSDAVTWAHRFGAAGCEWPGAILQYRTAESHTHFRCHCRQLCLPACLSTSLYFVRSNWC